MALSDGTVIVEDETGDADLAPLADAVETQLGPPYRARAVARGDGLWAVAARGIDVATFAAEGDDVTLTQHGEVRTLTVDAAETFGTIPALETIGARQGDSYVVRARRIDGDAWEVSVDPL